MCILKWQGVGKGEEEGDEGEDSEEEDEEGADEDSEDNEQEEEESEGQFNKLPFSSWESIHRERQH